MDLIKQQIIELLKSIGVSGVIELTTPPKPEMGDLAFACFGLAKEQGKNPAEVAKDLKKELDSRLRGNDALEKVEVFGPYVNFYLNNVELAKMVLNQKDPSTSFHSAQGKVMVEFAHPNTHKPVHIGHLRTMITGESMARIFENVGNKVVRANYQGDVGMHIAKCLWGIMQDKDWEKIIKNLKTTSERAIFLGQVYARGGQAYEKDEQAKKEIEEINAKIYSQDKSIRGLYKKTRKWSLNYFDYIYQRVDTHFDRFYFESECFELGKKIVLEGVKNGIFEESQGAIIFAGSKYGLHDRVFVNSKGLPTYEAKDMALARLQFKEYHPDFIYHVVAKEQTEYFKVMFKALEFTLPNSKDKEKHLVYGWVSLKEGKMSSRTGQVILAEWLLDEAEKKITEVMKGREIENKEKIIRKIANAAIKYSMLKTGIGNDIIFDINEAVSLTGDSGPYLLYIVARIKSILRKSKAFLTAGRSKVVVGSVEPQEKSLILQIAQFPEVTKEAVEKLDPSRIAKYLFELAQKFNSFYENCPVLQAESVVVRDFRLQLISMTGQAMEHGLGLLGITAIDEM
ncbi:MAG: Arginine-tRNA ligase [Candidatus Magasanikbacteria bacterium GW2011_GWC2_37_14]|uniref:Arginine--tRNA ligase n=1 Tax=Candidatus Magasanikbacteria bacterium GW2011_GWC2_37_14 TaxID=1619046 RepID=A0A0G0GBM7_9BACT|nr:MAG: Arginine-tRNA ligase [Candidatus Magasanikbacteria bacterium GW2011_GWC2_37_14]